MKKFPGYKVIGEEAAAMAGYIPAADLSSLTWIIDPIDGIYTHPTPSLPYSNPLFSFSFVLFYNICHILQTIKSISTFLLGTQNFVHGYPSSCVSVGLYHPKAGKDGVGCPVMGVVYDPYKDEVFTAVINEGAYLNGIQIKTDSSIKNIHKSLVLMDFGYDRTKTGVKLMVDACGRLLTKNTQAIRIIGSSVLSLVWVACGRANAFVIGFHREGGKPWDYCAAYVIATEAGAVFKQLDGRTWADDDDDDVKSEEDVIINNQKAIPPKTFDIYSQSCICAGTLELANEIFETVDSKVGSKSCLAI